MKVLIINTYETKGGAAVAAKRLMHALDSRGIEVRMLVKDKRSTDKSVHTTGASLSGRILSKANFIAERLQIFLANKFSKKNLFAVSTASTGFNIAKNPLVKEADIIHLHWINQGFLSIVDIENLLKLGKPVVWTMHDMWPITGICHHSGDCMRYSESCGMCKFLKEPSNEDLSYKIFKQKKRYLCNAGINFVACSKWLESKAEASVISNGNHLTNIPNPIDTGLFSPGSKTEARNYLNLPQKKKLLLFGATIASDKRKGLDYLIEATHLLSDLKEDVELIFCGEVKEEISGSFGLKTHSLGYISDISKIVKMYQAADCFIIPSLEENLPNMIMEAMSCGVPCIGFEVGGIPEMIEHKVTGYVSRYKSAEDFAFGIREILKKSEDVEFRLKIRDSVVERYSESIVADKYIELYNKALR